MQPADPTDALLPPLQQYLANRWAGARVSDLQFLTSGFESAVYTFLLNAPGQAAQACILRLYPGPGAGDKMVREANGLSHLFQTGYPVPVMLLYETDPAVLGKPFNVMEKLEGSSLWPVLARSTPEEAAALLDRFTELLVRLHRLDWRPFIPHPERYEANPALLLAEDFAASRRQFEQFDIPTFLPVLDWLESHLGQIQVRPAVAHLDFHANNVFLRSDGSLAVIDWTQVTAADYRADLAWTLQIMGDFGQPEWGERILAAYQSAAGYPAADLAYFQVISALKLLASMAIARKIRPADPEIPAFGILARRVKRITGVTLP